MVLEEIEEEEKKREKEKKDGEGNIGNEPWSAEERRALLEEACGLLNEAFEKLGAAII